MTRVALAAIAVMLAWAVGSLAEEAGVVPRLRPACDTPPTLLAIKPPLTHLGARVKERGPLKVVAVGSSSTQGVGASNPGLSYPSRLEAELRQRFPENEIEVVNRGKGGEDAPEELARLDRDVVAAHPDLVIWQVGTNAVLRRDDLAVDDALIERGVALLKQGGSDIVLMDMQYAPRVIARPAYATMQELIAGVAEHTHVGLFRRFDIMRYWHEKHGEGAVPMIGPDGLHMNDQGYGCLASEVAEAVAANWRTHFGAGRRPESGAVAGLDRRTKADTPVAAATAH